MFRSRKACIDYARRLAIAGLALFSLPSPSLASPDLFSAETLSVSFDLRLVAADGERSWTDRGFGKTRHGGDHHSTEARLVPAEALLIWQPRFGWNIRGTVTAAVQHEQEKPVDLVEAYLTFSPVPRSPTKWSGRFGLLWPAISMEHEGIGWSVPDMITPSAINSWIGEEVKVIGAEVTATRDIAGNKISGTAGIFGFNDTAGTLLAFRGWALHDLKATAFSHQELPRLNTFMQRAQAPSTKPLIELDDRPGFYGKLRWQLQAPVLLEAFYYDNRGDPEVKNDDRHWGWKTRFFSAGARIDFSTRTFLLAQALVGTTIMGFENAHGRRWVETRYRSAYARVSHRVDRLTYSGRIDLFDTRERGFRLTPDEDERGWSITGAASLALSDKVKLLVEALRVDSRKAVRLRDSIDPRQKQHLAHISFRLAM